MLELLHKTNTALGFVIGYATVYHQREAQDYTAEIQSQSIWLKI